MNFNPSESPALSIHDKNQLLEQKLKSLAEDMVQLDRKLEQEKRYFSPNIIGRSSSYNELSNEVSLDSVYSIENADDLMRSYGTGDAPLLTRTFKPAKEMKLGGYNRKSTSAIITPNPECNKKLEIAETNPRLFFSWNTNMEDFHSKWIHKKLNKILEEGSEESIHKDLFTKMLKTSLIERSENEEVLSNSSGECDAKQEQDAKEIGCISRIEKSKELLCHLEEEYQNESFLHKYKTKLKEVEERCLSQLKSLDEEPHFVKEEYTNVNNEILTNTVQSKSAVQKQEGILDEDLIIECFKDPDFTNYKSVPFAQVAKELETLEGMLKTINGLDVPKNELED